MWICRANLLDVWSSSSPLEQFSALELPKYIQSGKNIVCLGFADISHQRKHQIGIGSVNVWLHMTDLPCYTCPGPRGWKIPEHRVRVFGFRLSGWDWGLPWTSKSWYVEKIQNPRTCQERVTLSQIIRLSQNASEAEEYVIFGVIARCLKSSLPVDCGRLALEVLVWILKHDTGMHSVGGSVACVSVS